MAKTARTTSIAVITDSRGAELVELAIILPLFVGLLFGCFDLARLANGYAAVHSAAFRGSRDAAALDRPEWNAVTSINFAGSPPGVNVGNEIDISGINNTSFRAPEFRTSDAAGALIADSSWYTCMMGAGGAPSPCVTSQSLTSLYRVEARAIALATQVLKENTGTSNYPCDANSPAANVGGVFDTRYLNCGRCFSLRNDPSYDGFFSSGGPGSKWFIKVLAIRCEMDVPITTTSVALGWLPRYLTVKSDVFVDVDFYGNGFFYPDP